MDLLDTKKIKFKYEFITFTSVVYYCIEFKDFAWTMTKHCDQIKANVIV